MITYAILFEKCAKTPIGTSDQVKLRILTIIQHKRFLSAQNIQDSIQQGTQGRYVLKDRFLTEESSK